MRKALLSLIALAAIHVFLPGVGRAADFVISPVRLFFDGGQKATTITVKNNSGEKLDLQLNAYLWTQDDAAENVYSPTDEIIIFPKILTVEGQEERLIRVGTRVSPGDEEKTFRLYLEELPRIGEEPGERATVRTLTRIGIPIFVRPAGTTSAGDIEDVALSGGTLTFRVRNSGNVHLLVRAVQVEGADEAGSPVFRLEMGGWYLHKGRVKTLSLDIPRDKCLGMKTLRVDVVESRVPMSKRINVLPEMCSP